MHWSCLAKSALCKASYTITIGELIRNDLNLFWASFQSASRFTQVPIFEHPTDGRILGLIAVRLSVLPRSSTLWSPVGKSLLVASHTTLQVAFSGRLNKIGGGSGRSKLFVDWEGLRWEHLKQLYTVQAVDSGRLCSSPRLDDSRARRLCALSSLPSQSRTWQLSKRNGRQSLSEFDVPCQGVLVPELLQPCRGKHGGHPLHCSERRERLRVYNPAKGFGCVWR